MERSSRPDVCPKTGRRLEADRARHFGLLYTLAGLAALLWFLLRVIPKPSRAAYPCQRMAFPLASSFVLWAAALLGSLFAFRKARAQFCRARYLLGGLCAAGGALLAVLWGLSLPGEPASAVDCRVFISSHTRPKP